MRLLLLVNLTFQTINTVAEVIRGNHQNQEYFASVLAPSVPPRYDHFKKFVNLLDFP